MSALSGPPDARAATGPSIKPERAGPLKASLGSAQKGGPAVLLVYAVGVYSVGVVVVETRAFTRRIDDMLSPEEYRLFQLAIVERPDLGKVIRGTGGLRKVRWSIGGRGKRGGARVIYFWHPPSHQLLMLFAFAKNEADDLT